MCDTKKINNAPFSEIIFSDDDCVGYRIVSSFAGTNTYVLVNLRCNSAIIIDPGVGCFEIVEEILKSLSCRTHYVILTHEHYDHIGSLNEVRNRFSVKVIASTECSCNIQDPKKNLSVYLGPNGYMCKSADFEVADRVTEIPWCGRPILVVRTPGHTNGGISIYFPNYMFTGDTLIKNEKTIVKLPGGNQAQLARSLQFIRESFAADTLILPGHGDSFFLAEMRVEISCPAYFTVLNKDQSGALPV